MVNRTCFCKVLKLIAKFYKILIKPLLKIIIDIDLVSTIYPALLNLNYI